MPPFRPDSPRSSGTRSSRPPRGERPPSSSRRHPREEELVELEYAEALGITVDEAIKNALEILGADADEVEVQVLAKGHRSFLGLGRSTPYRVRVSWREDMDEEVLEEEVPAEESVKPVAAPPVVAAPRPVVAAPRQAPLPEPEPPAPRVSRPTQPLVQEEAARHRPPAASGSASPFEITAQTRQLLRGMGFEPSVDVQIQEGEIWIRLGLTDEEDEYLLHGRRGETRAALQHLLQRLVAPRTENGPAVLVDINGRWERRLDDLRSEALDLARRAVEESRPFRTRPLPSEERRIVHRALADRTDVRTHSEGEGREKRVVISPAESSIPT